MEIIEIVYHKQHKILNKYRKCKEGVLKQLKIKIKLSLRLKFKNKGKEIVILGIQVPIDKILIVIVS